MYIGSVSSNITVKEPLYFLLIGELIVNRTFGIEYPEREWYLNIYASPKTRRIAAKKLKRRSRDIVFIEWDVTTKQIIDQGKVMNVEASDKVLMSDKLDIMKQMLSSDPRQG